MYGREPRATPAGLYCLFVCVQYDWSDGKIERFAESFKKVQPKRRWKVRKQGDSDLGGVPERCFDRIGFVHVMLDC